MTEPCSRPWHSGPPKWVHVLSRQYTLPATLNNAYGLWLADTHFAPPSGTSLSIPRMARIDHREAGPAKVVVVGRTALGAGGQRGGGGRGGDLLSFGRPLHRAGRWGPAGDDPADGIEEIGPDERLVFPRPIPPLPRRGL